MHVEGDRFQVRLDELVAVLQGLRRDQLSVRFPADEADRNQLLTGIYFCQEVTAADSAFATVRISASVCPKSTILCLPFFGTFSSQHLFIVS